MSYLVLARKYRPQTFDEVYSQEHITRILKNSISQDRIGQAYLFTGTRGVGKTSLARIFAKSLNCLTDGPTPTPCNTCQNCIEITNGTSSDVIEIDGASNTGVEDIRDLQKELMYAPTHSHFKIYIIDEVHMLSKNAFNALLKTLEEPPANVVFIFATTEPHKILPTIISRCQRFDFRRIPIADIVKHLKEIAVSEKISMDDDAFFIIARKADGSMRDALSLMDQVLAFKSDDIKTEDVLQIFGIVHHELYNLILKNIIEKKAAVLITQIKEVLEKGTDINEFLNGFLSSLRDILLVKIGVIPQEIIPSNLKNMEALASAISQEKILYLMNLVIKTKAEVKVSDNPVLILEMSFIKFTKLTELHSLDKIITSFDKALAKRPVMVYKKEEKASAPILPRKEIPKPATKPEIKQPEIHKEPEKLKDIKLSKKMIEDAKEALEKKMDYLLKISFNECSIESISDKNQILITSFTKIRYNALEGNAKVLEKIFKNHFGTKVSFKFQLKEKPKAMRRPLKPTIEAIEKENPEIAEFIRIIGGEIED